MSPTLKALGIDKLTAAQRIALAQEILDSILAEQPPPPLSEPKRLELERRVAEDDASPEDVIPWDQVKAQTLARLQS